MPHRSISQENLHKSKVNTWSEIDPSFFAIKFWFLMI